MLQSLQKAGENTTIFQMLIRTQTGIFPIYKNLGTRHYSVIYTPQNQYTALCAQISVL